jgi:hypothetical protein
MSQTTLQSLTDFFALIGDSGALRITILLAILGGYWLGLSRARIAGAWRVVAWIAIAAPLICWFVTIWSIAMAGVFDPHPGALPLLPIAIFVPLLVGLTVLTRSKIVARVLDATPPEWLIGLQVYRSFGAAFLVQWGLGHLSARFALPAGTGDVLVGMLALPTAVLFRTSPLSMRGLALAWNIFGITDLLLAISLGIVGQIARSRGLGDALPPNPIGYPLVMIPAFAVPLSLILHGLSIYQLRRRVCVDSAKKPAHPAALA